MRSVIAWDTVISVWTATDLAWIMTSRTVITWRQTKVPVETNAERTAYWKDVSGAIKHSVPCDVAARTCRSICTCQTARVTVETQLAASIIPKPIHAFTQTSRRVNLPEMRGTTSLTCSTRWARLTRIVTSQTFLDEIIQIVIKSILAVAVIALEDSVSRSIAARAVCSMVLTS